MSTWDDKPNDYEHAVVMIEELRAKNARLRAAGQALIDDVKRRYPGEELRCPYMRALEAALADQGKG